MTAKDQIAALSDEIAELQDQIDELRAELGLVPIIVQKRRERAELERQRRLGALAKLAPAERLSALVELGDRDRETAINSMGLDRFVETLQLADEVTRRYLINCTPGPWRDRIRVALVPDDKVTRYVWTELADRSRSWSRASVTVTATVAEQMRKAGLDVYQHEGRYICTPPGYGTGDRVRMTRQALDLLIEHDPEFARACREGSIVVSVASLAECRAAMEIYV